MHQRIILNLKKQKHNEIKKYFLVIIDFLSMKAECFTHAECRDQITYKMTLMVNFIVMLWNQHCLRLLLVAEDDWLCCSIFWKEDAPLIENGVKISGFIILIIQSCAFKEWSLKTKKRNANVININLRKACEIRNPSRVRSRQHYFLFLHES